MGCSQSDSYKADAPKVDAWVQGFPAKEGNSWKMIIENTEAKNGALSEQDRAAIAVTEKINQQAAAQLARSEKCGKLTTPEEDQVLASLKKLNAAVPIKEEIDATNDLIAALNEIMAQYKKGLATTQDLADVTFKGISDTNDEFQRIDPDLRAAVAAADQSIAEEEQMESRTKDLATQLARENQELQHKLAEVKMRDDRLSRQHQKNVDEATKLSNDYDRLQAHLEEAGGVTDKHFALTNIYADTLKRHGTLNGTLHNNVITAA